MHQRAPKCAPNWLPRDSTFLDESIDTGSITDGYVYDRPPRRLFCGSWPLPDQKTSIGLDLLATVLFLPLMGAINRQVVANLVWKGLTQWISDYDGTVVSQCPS